MGKRNFPSNQLVLAEDELYVLTRWADDVGMQLGEIADGIHFDGHEPPDVTDLLEQVKGMRRTVGRAEGLLLAYEIARRSRTTMRESANDDATAR